MTSHPSVNFTPRMIFGNWLWPSRRRQVFCAPSTSLNTMASAVLFERHPFERIVLCRTVAKVLSIAFVTGMRVPAPMSGCGFRDRGIWCDHPGQRRREHEGAGRPISYVELRARVSSWPPLRLARLRRERESVVVV